MQAWHKQKRHKVELLTKKNGENWVLGDGLGNALEAALWALITISPMPNKKGIDATLRAAFVDKTLF